MQKAKGGEMAARKELIRVFRDRAGLTVRESALCAEALVEWMKETLAAGGGIELRGFGTFEIKQVSEKHYPSVFSGERLIPAHGKIVFRPCRKLKEAVRKRKG